MTRTLRGAPSATSPVVIMRMRTMTKQSKSMTHIEVTSNQIVGIIIGWCIVYFLFPLFEHLNQAHVATISTVLFFISSYTRSYLMRRLFETFK